MSWKILGNRESQISHQPIDTVGLVLLVLGVGCLQLMLDQGESKIGLIQRRLLFSP